MKITKVLLIHSAHHHENGTLVHARRWWERFLVANIAELALPWIAAQTPEGIEIELVDEYFTKVPETTDAQVVGISAQVMQHSRAIEIADQFKAQGKKVIMGGYLPTLYPESVQDHVDAICIGDGDNIWPIILDDIQNNQLKPVYQEDTNNSLENLPTPRYDLIKRFRLTSYPIQATRGCPFKCNYCSIIQFFDGSYRLRPVDEIIRDIKATKSRFIHFTDDNLMENKKFAKSLFKAMKPLNIHWGAQVTINIAKDNELLSLAYDAGCRMAAVGIESLSQDNQNLLDKPFNKTKDYAKAIETIQSHGIGFHALVILGLPNDTPETFDQINQFLTENNVAGADFFICTPYPGTGIENKINGDNRSSRIPLSHFRESFLLFEHPHISKDIFISKYWQLHRNFYSIKNIIRRIIRGNFNQKWYHLGMNLGYWLKIKRKIIPVYFGRGN